jgi:hypothetical protein
MIFLSFVKMMWGEVFSDLYLVGKLITAPFFAIATILCIPSAILAFFLLDIWTIILFALSKDLTIGDFFAFYFE